MEIELSIVYVNWNSLDYLRESIASVYECTRNLSFEIIVVDNASPEAGIESIAESFSGLKLIKSKQNLGFAGANNLGFRNASGKYVLFLNPDTKLVSPSINVMVDRIQNLPDAGIVGCKLLNTDLSVQLSSIQTFPTILNQAIDAEYLRLRWPQCPLWKIGPLFSDKAELIQVDVIPGACMLLRREVFEQVDMFSEDYFMYAEDLDLNYKVKESGFNNYYVGNTAIIHHGGRSSSRQTVSHWATIMKYRAMLRLFRKTRGSLYAVAYRIAMGAVAATRVFILGLMYPLSDIFWNRTSLKFALNKWAGVLKWAITGQDVAI
jgi:GT2 family glycosyltransferase